MKRLFVIVSVTLSVSCTENNIASLKGASPPVDPVVDTAEPEVDSGWVSEPGLGPPQAEVSPDNIDLGIVCGEQMQRVSVTSRGETPLEIQSIEVVGSGWLASVGPLPATLETGEVFEIEVRSTGGSSQLRITTNEPDGSPIEVPLVALADEPPLVIITTPGSGETLSPGAEMRFEARVVDDLDGSESLNVEWSSNVDGILSTEPVLSEGTAMLDWNGTTRSSGEHRVQLAVVDSCGNSTIDAVGFCQNEGYTEDSIDLESWHFEGSSFWDTTNGWVELTGPYTNQAGTAFQTTSTVSSEAVSIEFSFFVSGGSGADGISLTAIDSERMTSFVGGTGGGIGYAGLPGWSIEIDTWYNSHSDPTTEDHLSVHLDGNVDSPLTWSPLPEMEDDAWHLASINVSGSHMTIAIDGVTYIDESVAGLGSFPAYIGFTGATGSATNYHLIDALEVEGFVCEE